MIHIDPKKDMEMDLRMPTYVIHFGPDDLPDVKFEAEIEVALRETVESIAVGLLGPPKKRRKRKPRNTRSTRK